MLKEFASHGYANASTNRMVQEAGIGKGMLFYYFKSKEELYRYCLEYCIDFISSEYLAQLDLTEPDFMIRFKKAGEIKMRAYLQNPLPFLFLASTYIRRDAPELVPDLYQRLEELTANGLKAMFANIDTSLFRQDVPPEQIINLIRWAIDGWSSETIAALENQDLTDYDWDSTFAEFDELLSALRKILYRRAAHGDCTGE